MQNSEIIHRPVIDVSIGGTLAGERPSSFLLHTLAGCPSVIAELRFPSEAETGKEGDAVTVSLVNDDKTDLYFTGSIFKVGKQAQYRVLYLADSYMKLKRTEFTAAYRKEKAMSILEDILVAAGIERKSITCPRVELARFSTKTIPAWLAIDLLIDALREHGEEGLTYFLTKKTRFISARKKTPGRTGARFLVLKARKPY